MITETALHEAMNQIEVFFDEAHKEYGEEPEKGSEVMEAVWAKVGVDDNTAAELSIGVLMMTQSIPGTVNTIKMFMVGVIAERIAQGSKEDG